MIEEIEKLRKKVLQKRTILIVVIIAILTLSFIIFKENGYFSIFVAFIFAIIGEAIFVSKDAKKFSKMYKENIVVTTFKSMFNNVDFNLENGISREVLRNTQMMYTGDRFTSNDYVKGTYKNINFECSDVHIQREDTDSDGNTTYVTVFKGQWYIFDFNKSFKSNIMVSEKSFYCSIRSGLKKVELEDIDFNKKFNVYAKEEIDAFYVLTPNTMQKIKDITNKLKGHLAFFFVNNRLHIGFDNGKDLFEPKISKKLNFEEATRKTKEEIGFITDFVDMLDLDNDLFKNG